MQKQEITFKLSVLYFPEQNGVSKRTGKIIMDMTRETIFEKNINNNL